MSGRGDRDGLARPPTGAKSHAQGCQSRYQPWHQGRRGPPGPPMTRASATVLAPTLACPRPPIAGQPHVHSAPLLLSKGTPGLAGSRCGYDHATVTLYPPEERQVHVLAQGDGYRGAVRATALAGSSSMQPVER